MGNYPQSLVTVVPLASVPLPGLPPSAVDSLTAGGHPVRFNKANSYDTIQFGWTSTLIGSGSYALYRYWPEDQDWKPEGPRGATPTTVDMSSVATLVPVRISCPKIECDVIVVLCAGIGISQGEGTYPVTVQAQNR